MDTPVLAPQVDYRESPNAAGRDLAADHIDRDHLNVGGTVQPPQMDASFYSYDVPGDAEGKWDQMIHDQALQVGRD